MLAASIFHFGEYTVGEAKAFMADQGITMRLVTGRAMTESPRGQRTSTFCSTRLGGRLQGVSRSDSSRSGGITLKFNLKLPPRCAASGVSEG